MSIRRTPFKEAIRKLYFNRIRGSGPSPTNGLLVELRHSRFEPDYGKELFGSATATNRVDAQGYSNRE